MEMVPYMSIVVLYDWCPRKFCIHSAVKPENYLAMIRATKEFGAYPIA